MRLRLPGINAAGFRYFFIGAFLSLSIHMMTQANAANVGINQPINPAIWNQNRDRIIALQNRVNGAIGFYVGMSCGAYLTDNNTGDVFSVPCVINGIEYLPQNVCPPGFIRGGSIFPHGTYYTCVRI